MIRKINRKTKWTQILYAASVGVQVVFQLILTGTLSDTIAKIKDTFYALMLPHVSLSNCA
jgi:hypothetical protein